MSDFKKPSLPGQELFEAQPGGDDPAERAAAGHRIANLLVRGPRSAGDRDMVERVLHLADEEGLAVIAELWAPAGSDSVAGALWRLYALRTWVHRQPDQAALAFSGA